MTVSRLVTMADLLASLGDIPPERGLLRPSPGMATKEDLLTAWDRDRLLCELIDGTLVKKTAGMVKSYVAMLLGMRMLGHAMAHDLGYCVGASGMTQIAPGKVRLPDAAYISWERAGVHYVSSVPIPDLYPDLAVEVISEGNSRAEMIRKLHEYFDAGVSLVWYVYPKTRTAIAYTSPETFTEIDAHGELDGGGVLPGFSLRLEELFRSVEPQA